MTEENGLLFQIGLSDKEAEIYQILLKKGKVPASKILPETKLKRTTVYSILDELTGKNIIEKDETDAIIEFRAKHPYALKEYLENRVSQIKKVEGQLEAILPSFIDFYHQSQNRPGIKFYEGKEGVKKVLQDTLTATTEILTIADVEAIDKYIKEINREYVIARNKNQIKKRLLVADSEYARQHFAEANQLTEVKFFNLKINPFSTSIQIYDNKIAYITMTDHFLSSTLLEDSYVYSMHQALFEFIWSKI